MQDQLLTSQRLKSYILSALFSFLFTVTIFAQDDDGITTDEAVVVAGEKLFKANCTQCHAINQVVIGPALKDVHKRLETNWLIPWIKNSQKMIQDGDEYALQIYNEYQKTAMPAYPFSDAEVMSILSYIKVESSKEVVVVAAADGGTGEEAAKESIVSDGFLMAIMVILVVVLVLILFVLGLFINVLTRFVKEKGEVDAEDLEVVDQKTNWQKFFLSDGVVGVVVFVFIAIMLKTLIDGAFSIGIQQGYEPTQPIAYSHKLHAGDFEIDCNYCHTGVRKSKSANIPSPNICMNCHSAIQNISGKTGISPEIQKIYNAIDYDPATGEYGTNTKPIEWVRIHNLPDLAYFNHSQHVEVGGVECQTCHGQIQEMEVVYQFADLTMGWCINCHRETDVNTKGNAYYDELVMLHGDKAMKVEDIGGLECSKCHY